MIDVVPQIRGRAERAENDRRIPCESLSELIELGLFRAFVPARFGGDEAEIKDVHRALIELAIACPSTAWVASLFVTHSLTIVWLDARAQSEVWEQGPSALIASSFAPVGTATKVEGGYSLNGRWSFSSGIDHAGWVAVLAKELRDASKEKTALRLCLVPAGDIVIEDDWHVAGLRATGSKSFRVDNVFVPAYRTEDMNAVSSGNNLRAMENRPPLFRVPWKILFDHSFCPVAIGTARAALMLYCEQTNSRLSAFGGGAARHKPSAWLRLAESAANIDAARLVLSRDLEWMKVPDALHRCQHGAKRSQVEFGPAHVVDLCSQAVARLFRGSGGRAVYESNPLQRFFRDMNAITQHVAVDIDAAREVYGRALLEAVARERLL